MNTYYIRENTKIAIKSNNDPEEILKSLEILNLKNGKRPKDEKMDFPFDDSYFTTNTFDLSYHIY